MTDTPMIGGARALAKADAGEDCYDKLDLSMQKKLQENVRASTLAMRTPSNAMIGAGLTVELPRGRRLTELEVMLVWERMIDVAVSDMLHGDLHQPKADRTTH
jgi:hypothetical protein